MIIKVTPTMFHEAFMRSETYKNNFSYSAKNALYDYFMDYESDNGEQVELDIVAICCEWCESSPEEIKNDYQAIEDELEENYTHDQLCETVEWFLEEKTDVIQLHTGDYLYRSF